MLTRQPVPTRLSAEFIREGERESERARERETLVTHFPTRRKINTAAPERDPPSRRVLIESDVTMKSEVIFKMTLTNCSHTLARSRTHTYATAGYS